jgi:ketosteroid isomerase-like protein
VKRPLALALVLAAGPAAAQTPSPSPSPSPSPFPSALPSALPSVTLPAPLARVLTDYEEAWAGKDAAALAALFAEDGFVLSSGAPPVRGRAAIERHYAGQGGPLALRALAYSTQGSIGFIIGGFARARGEPDIGKFTLTLVKGARGRWLIQSDMDNGNARSR